MNKWNTQKIINDNGGPVDLHAKLKAHGYAITLHAVRAWARRGSIPSEWIATILTLNGENPKTWIMEDIFG